MYREKLQNLENICKKSNDERINTISLGLIELFYDNENCSKEDIEICDRIKFNALPLLKQKLETKKEYEYYKNIDKEKLYNSLVKMIFEHSKEELEYDIGFFVGIYYLFENKMSIQDKDAYKNFKGLANTKINAFSDD